MSAIAKQQILSNGPRTSRWIDRAEWLYYVAERRGDEDHIKMAYSALLHFVEAQDLRRCYERGTKKAYLRASAAKEYRRGVKAYRTASEMIFGKPEG